MLLAVATQHLLYMTKEKQQLIDFCKNKKKAQQLSKVFNTLHMSQDQVGRAGITLFVLLYGGKVEDTLHHLRYTCYMKMAASSSKITPAKLPPTERAA